MQCKIVFAQLIFKNGLIMNKFKLLHFLLPLSLCILTVPSTANEQSNDLLKKGIRAHIEFLADDKLKGRETGTEEYEIAARYVASHFKQFGLKPGGENGSWFQPVTFIESTPDTKAYEMSVHTKTKKTSFQFPDQFLGSASPFTEAAEVRAEVVFVGYGIISKELKHNDYFGMDVKGKIVAVLSGKPASFPSEQGAHTAHIRQKLKYAADKGAIGFIRLHTNMRDKVRKYEKYIPTSSKPAIYILNKEGGVIDSEVSIKGYAYLSKETGKSLFSSAGYDLGAIFDDLAIDKIPSGFNMGVDVTLKRKATHNHFESSNVVGILEGSDPVLKNEYVVYSAHLDHIGVRAHSDKADKINNGAIDNASGVALMIETARLFAQGKRPKRSILFVAVTAEEKGLLGSNFFAHYPTVPVQSMVASINLDMPVILYPFTNIVAFGAEHSTLGSYVERAVKLHGLTLSPDPIPEQTLFVRSDHYSFVKQGIPSIYLTPGFTSSDPDVDGKTVFYDFISTHYHQETDEATLPINYDSGALFTRVNFDIGREIANSKYKPQWNEGDFFGDTFKKN